MSTLNYLDEWSDDLVDPRGQPLQQKGSAKPREVDAWPIRWSRRRVGLLSNRKPNADAILQEIRHGLHAAAPDLTFIYGSKEPLAEEADAAVIDSLSECDVAILASAECGGCTSWLCRDQINLENRGVPCLLIATNRFESLARTVLSRGGILHPHLAIPKHPVSGIAPEQLQAKIREIMPHISAELLGRHASSHASETETA